MGSTGRACCPTVSPTRECWRILTACGEGAVGSTFRTCCRLSPLPSPPHQHTHTRGWILSANDGIWNMLFSTYSHTFKRVRSNGCLSPVVAVASAICSDCLHRSPNSPFALSRLANPKHAVAASLRLRVPSWQHVNRRVLRELDIEFEPSRRWEADIARERKLLQLRVLFLCDRFGISQDRMWNLDETAVRTVPAGDRGWSKRAESTHVFASRAFVTLAAKHERRHVDTDCL